MYYVDFGDNCLQCLCRTCNNTYHRNNINENCYTYCGVKCTGEGVAVNAEDGCEDYEEYLD